MARRKPKRRWWRRLWPYALLTFLLAAAGLSVYLVYLDGQVRARFEGAVWQLPAKVYANPLELFPGRELDRGALVDALEAQGYRRSDGTERPGSYNVRTDGVALHTRRFSFWDGVQPAQRVLARFSDGRISGLRGFGETQADLALVRLDPLLIGSIYPKEGEDRILVKLGEVPQLLPAGLIVVEDQQFLDHHGVSPKAILRAAWANLRAGGVVQGGSTITQQLVKNFYLTNRQTLARKAKEALMAILLDARYDKEAILEAYLNEIYLGQDGSRAIHGFGLASHFYFQKPLEELRAQEIALLVAMVKGPSYYDPRRHPERAKTRRDLVLSMFADAGLIDPEQAEKAKSAPLDVVEKAPRGTTQYPAFIDLVQRQLRGQYRDEDLTSEGLRIFTTLDPRVQTATERRITNGIEDLESSRGMKEGTLQAAAVVTSVEGGRVLAVVGGREARFAGFNRALDAKRPIGSLMKPVVYLTALDRPGRYNVLTPLDDTELSVSLPNGDVWRPENYDRQSHGENVPLYRALVHSYNVATARLATQLGLPSVVDTLKKLGYPGDPVPVPSLALGTVDMSPMEVAQIYNTLAGGGYRTPLLSIRAVTTKEGEPLSRYPLQLKRAVDESSVFLLNWILQRVVREGTAASAYYTLPGSLQVAGKTGTTDELRDSWFAGFAGDRVGVVWVGRDDNKAGELTGAGGALQLWARILRDIEPKSFDPLVPEGVETVPLALPSNGEDEDDSGDAAPVAPRAGAFDWMGARRDCSRAVPVPFIAGSVPEDIVPCRHGARRDSDADPVTESGARKPERSAAEPRQREKSNWFMDLFR